MIYTSNLTLIQYHRLIHRPDFHSANFPTNTLLLVPIPFRIPHGFVKPPLSLPICSSSSIIVFHLWRLLVTCSVECPPSWFQFFLRLSHDVTEVMNVLARTSQKHPCQCIITPGGTWCPVFYCLYCWLRSLVRTASARSSVKSLFFLQQLKCIWWREIWNCAYPPILILLLPCPWNVSSTTGPFLQQELLWYLPSGDFLILSTNKEKFWSKFQGST